MQGVFFLPIDFTQLNRKIIKVLTSLGLHECDIKTNPHGVTYLELSQETKLFRAQAAISRGMRNDEQTYYSVSLELGQEISVQGKEKGSQPKVKMKYSPFLTVRGYYKCLDLETIILDKMMSITEFRRWNDQENHYEALILDSVTPVSETNSGNESDEGIGHTPKRPTRETTPFAENMVTPRPSKIPVPVNNAQDTEFKQ